MARAKRNAATAAPAAATAPAEQQGNLPAGPINNDGPAVVEGAGMHPALGFNIQNTVSVVDQNAAIEGQAALLAAQTGAVATAGTELTDQQGNLTDSERELTADALAAPAGNSVEGPDDVEALWVESVPASFRRCGFSFTREGVGIALNALSEQQLELLESEPNLRTERCVFSDKVQG